MTAKRFNTPTERVGTGHVIPDLPDDLLRAERTELHVPVRETPEKVGERALGMTIGTGPVAERSAPSPRDREFGITPSTPHYTVSRDRIF